MIFLEGCVSKKQWAYIIRWAITGHHSSMNEINPFKIIASIRVIGINRPSVSFIASSRCLSKTFAI